jgi:hypothetical protein
VDGAWGGAANGGVAGDGANVTVTNTGSLETSGVSSRGVFAQSLGGTGGGGGTGSGFVTEGGDGATAGNAGSVTVTNRGAIETAGNQSAAIFAQSVGGKGGDGGDSAGIFYSQAGAGGQGGDAGNAQVSGSAGAVSVVQGGRITTQGEDAMGIFAQAVGGGGGNGGSSTAFSVFGGYAVGGTGGGGGDGKKVTVTLEEFQLDSGGQQINIPSSLTTNDDRSIGILAQSVGGGGGSVITDTPLASASHQLNADNSGHGGDISFTQTGDVRTSGDNAVGILIQSLGGGGGLHNRQFMDSAGGAGTAGAITLSVDGNVTADGGNGVAVFVQSRGADGQDDIAVTLAENSIIYGGQGGAGVWLSGGADNHLVSNSSIATADGLDGMAVYATSGDDLIDSHHLFYGQFDLGAGSNTFVSHREAAFVPGAALKLGDAGNMLTSFGIMMPGDMGFAQQTDLAGSFTQGDTGLTYAELDFGSDIIDSLNATGSVQLGGELEVSLLNPQLIPVGHFEKNVFTGEHGVADNGMILTTAPSVVITYELAYSEPTAAVLNYGVDFSPEGLSDNLKEVGEYFNRIQIAGSSSGMAGTVEKLLYDPGMEEYRNSLSQMSPDFYGEHQAALIHSSQEFGQRMMSCRQAGGEYRFTREGSCYWMQVERETGTHDSHRDYKEIDYSADRYSIGVQKSFANDWSLGFGYSDEDIRHKGYSRRWSSSGDTHQFGLSLKKRLGATKFAGVLSYGWNETETRRLGSVVDQFQARSERDMDVLTGLFRVSHDYEFSTSYIRPSLDYGIARVSTDSVEETGAGSLSLSLKGRKKSHSWLRPGIEVGNEYQFDSGSRLRVHLNLGVRHFLDEPSTEVSAGFVGAPGGVAPMLIDIDLEETTYHGNIGLDFLTNDSFSLRLQYGVIRADSIDMDRGELKMVMPF